MAEPEYREMIVEALALMNRMDSLLKTEHPNIPRDRPFEVDSVVQRANKLFVEHNVRFWFFCLTKIIGNCLK